MKITTTFLLIGLYVLGCTNTTNTPNTFNKTKISNNQNNVSELITVDRDELIPAEFIGNGSTHHGTIVGNFLTKDETIEIPYERIIEINADGEWYVKPLDKWEFKTDPEDLPWAIKL